MSYLDWARLGTIDTDAFLSTKPYPWTNPAGTLTAEGFDELRQTLPDVLHFARLFDVRRSYGQRSHDRFTLEWRHGLDLGSAWNGFVSELRSELYMRFLRRLFGRRPLSLHFHWHYTPRGCSVSPHCDARRKRGSHVFYFNTDDDWDAAWGGETLVLDDSGRFDCKSAPTFEEFDRVLPAQSLGNRSFIFARRRNSWHGVREITCPQGELRKVFVVTINDRFLTLADRTWRRVRGKRVTPY